MAAAVLADRWPRLEAAGFSASSFAAEVDDPFRGTVTGRNLRNRAAVRWAVTRLLPRRHRGSCLGETLTRQLLTFRCVADLPAGVQAILTSTDLATGRAFRVARDFIGSWDFGYASPPARLRLGTALAASAAVPFIFPPVRLATAGLGLRDAPPVLSLVDGGVYDNLGLEWFQGWGSGRPPQARSVDLIVVVDASGMLRARSGPFRGWQALRRGQETQYAQTRASRVRWFVDQLERESLRGVYVPIDRDPGNFSPPDGRVLPPQAAAGSLPTGFASALSALRTDLDRFLPEEADLLRYHGYWSAHVRLSVFEPALAVSAPEWREFAELSAQDATGLLEVLRAGVRRSVARRGRRA